MPKAKAKDKFPFEVSKAIVVVITLVRWSILPPTIITAPTSEIALPNPAKITVKIEYLASYKQAIRALFDETTKDIKRSLYSSLISSIIWAVNETIIGIIKIIWATIIAVGVYNIPNQPNGPDREINKYTIVN